MQKISSLGILLWVLAVPSAILAADDDSGGRGWAVTGKAGTFGIGADISRSIVPRLLNVRAGAGFYSYKFDLSDDGIEYDADFKLGAVPIAADVFPFKNWFRIGGGLVINLTGLDGTGQAQNGTIKIGDNQYPVNAIGQLKTELRVNRLAPYLGFGFGNPIKRSGRVSFFADLGGIYHGTPTARVTTTRTIPEIQDDLDREAAEIEDDIRGYKFYPVVQFGVSYRF